MATAAVKTAAVVAAAARAILTSTAGLVGVVVSVEMAAALVVVAVAGTAKTNQIPPVIPHPATITTNEVGIPSTTKARKTFPVTATAIPELPPALLRVTMSD